MAHYVDARYDDHDGMFVPPIRTLGFNPQLRLNDSLLAQSYVEAYDLSYPEAVSAIEDEVREMLGDAPLNTEWSQKHFITKNFADIAGGEEKASETILSDNA